MLAAYYTRIGPANEVLQLGEMPTPHPAAGEVRVKVRWSGVNPSDVKMRLGSRGPVPSQTSIIPHSDGMGEIDAVGAGVDPSRRGERVWMWNAAWGRPHGTAAQYVVLPQAQAVKMPDSVPDEAGACFGIPALTALHAVLTDGAIAGQRVLVAGGAGAVGHYASQFARLLGAMHEHGEAAVRASIASAMSHNRMELLLLLPRRGDERPPPAAIPEALAHYHVEPRQASQYDVFIKRKVQ
jgi:NADPH2:quinone reductase